MTVSFYRIVSWENKYNVKNIKFCRSCITRSKAGSKFLNQKPWI